MAKSYTEESLRNTLIEGIKMRLSMLEEDINEDFEKIDLDKMTTIELRFLDKTIRDLVLLIDDLKVLRTWDT